MVDKKGKRPRAAATAAAAAAEEAGPAGRVAMKKLRGIQQELEKINNKSKEKLLEVKKQYKEKLKPVYSRRAEVIDEMPNFWLTMILRHRKLDNVLMFFDRKIFYYFESLNVEELELPRNGYCITFTFKENPYFENEKLTKTVEFSGDKTLTTISTTIIWKDGYDVLTRRHYHQNSFFNWFTTPKEEVEHDLIAEMIKDEIWANPLLDCGYKKPTYHGDSSSDDEDEDEDNDDVEEEESSVDDDDDDDGNDDDGGDSSYHYRDGDGDGNDSDSAYRNMIMN